MSENRYCISEVYLWDWQFRFITALIQTYTGRLFQWQKNSRRIRQSDSEHTMLDRDELFLWINNDWPPLLQVIVIRNTPERDVTLHVTAWSSESVHLSLSILLWNTETVTPSRTNTIHRIIEFLEVRNHKFGQVVVDVVPVVDCVCGLGIPAKGDVYHSSIILKANCSGNHDVTVVWSSGCRALYLGLNGLPCAIAIV